MNSDACNSKGETPWLFEAHHLEEWNNSVEKLHNSMMQIAHRWKDPIAKRKSAENKKGRQGWNF